MLTILSREAPIPREEVLYLEAAMSPQPSSRACRLPQKDKVPVDSQNLPLASRCATRKNRSGCFALLCANYHARTLESSNQFNADGTTGMKTTTACARSVELRKTKRYPVSAVAF